MRRPSKTLLGLAAAALIATGFAACGGGGDKPAPAVDAGTDAGLEASDDATTIFDVSIGPNDSGVAPEGIDLLSPDGCYRLGASCMDPSTCCSANCEEASCSAPAVHSSPVP